MSPALRFIALSTMFSLIPILWHFGTVFEFWGEAPKTQTELFVRIGIFVGFAIIGSIVTSILMAIATREDDFEPDEREKQVIRKAELTGYYILAAGVVLVMWFVFKPMTPMQTANALLAAFAISEVTKVFAGFLFLARGV